MVGVDVGGTFTDCVTMDAAGTVTVGKSLSTPEDYSIGALNAVRDAAESLGLADEAELLASTGLFFHACTIGDNALITGSGAVTGLITTTGFADTLRIMRGRFTDGVPESEIFHLATLDKPAPMVPRPLIEELDERVDYKGSVLVRLDPAQVEKAASSGPSPTTAMSGPSPTSSPSDTRTYSSAFPARWRRTWASTNARPPPCSTPASGRGSQPTSSGWEAGCGSWASTGSR